MEALQRRLSFNELDSQVTFPSSELPSVPQTPFTRPLSADHVTSPQTQPSRPTFHEKMIAWMQQAPTRHPLQKNDSARQPLLQPLLHEGSTFNPAYDYGNEMHNRGMRESAETTFTNPLANVRQPAVDEATSESRKPESRMPNPLTTAAPAEEIRSSTLEESMVQLSHDRDMPSFKRNNAIAYALERSVRHDNTAEQIESAIENTTCVPANCQLTNVHRYIAAFLRANAKHIDSSMVSQYPKLQAFSLEKVIAEAFEENAHSFREMFGAATLNDSSKLYEWYKEIYKPKADKIINEKIAIINSSFKLSNISGGVGVVGGGLLGGAIAAAGTGGVAIPVLATLGLYTAFGGVFTSSVGLSRMLDEENSIENLRPRFKQ